MTRAQMVFRYRMKPLVMVRLATGETKERFYVEINRKIVRLDGTFYQPYVSGC